MTNTQLSISKPLFNSDSFTNHINVTVSKVDVASISNMNQQNLTAANQEQLSPLSPLFARLAILSKQPKWILFTEEVPLPTKDELAEFNVNESKVIKTKASKTLSNKDLLIKVIDAKTTSAIVTSQTFSMQEKAQLQAKAIETDCEVFFISEDMQKLLTRSLH